MLQSRYKRHIEAVYDSCIHDSMLNRLLKVMSDTLDVSGVENGNTRRVEQKTAILAQIKRKSFNKVVMARFALGNDDGAYLRSNIMPLQTVIDDEDYAFRLGTKMSADMQRASYVGFLDAYEYSCSEKLSLQKKTLLSVWEMASWLLSIEEVGSFVALYIKQYCQGQDECVGSKAQALVSEARRPNTSPELDKGNDIDAFRVVLRAVLSIFGTAVVNSLDAQLKWSDETLSEFKRDLQRAREEVSGNSPLATKFTGQDQNSYEVELRASNADGKIGFALLRGLCGRRGPHHRVDPGASVLLYNTPLVRCPSESSLSRVLCDESYSSGQRQGIDHARNRVEMVANFCDFKEQGESMPAMWAPVSVSTPKQIDTSPQVEAVATASVIEHAVDYYKRKADQAESTEIQLDYLAHSALAKVRQLQPMASVFEPQATRIDKLCPPSDFQTIPVYKKSYDGEGSVCGELVLYAPDAGLVVVAEDDDEEGEPNEDAGKPMEELSKELFVQLQEAMCSILFVSEDVDRAPKFTKVATRPSVPLAFFQSDNSETPSFDKIQSVLSAGFALLDRRSALLKNKEETKAAREMLKSIDHEGMDADAKELEKMSRMRREEVWNDSMREAAIAGDRLYAFVRQLSGTIHESVDSVCVVDESMLVRQQKDRQADAKRLSMMASQQHMQLVSNVFRSVINESGLTLGIDSKKGLDGDLKVVSNTLRKQVSDLTSGSASSEGFFTNSVKLENLLAQGTGEITLSGLFSRLRDVGLALQDAAVHDADDPGDPGGPSLDFLSSPRNSLILRWKPEAHAAVRQAYDTFQREMGTRHRIMGTLGRHRKISAYELIEGRNDELSMAFATYCAHVLAHQRMFSAGQAAYLGNWAARANVAAMKFSCDKLITVACEYVSDVDRPRFVDENGWCNYFGVHPD